MPTLYHRIAERLREPEPPPIAEPDHFPPADVAAMLREIGAALVEASQPVQVVEQRLIDIGARYTTAPVQAAVLPTMLFVQIGDTVTQMDSSVQPSGQLDHAGRVAQIAALATAGTITPQAAVAAVRAARAAPPRFGAVLSTAGYALTTVGFGLMLQPSWKALLAHLSLGLVVGLIVALARPFPALTPVVPTASALVVTLLATWFVVDVAHDGLLRVISPALIATLPGMALVIGAIELAGGRVVSGSGRVVYGIVQLGLMVYGVVLGIHIAGAVDQQLPSPSMGGWTLYAAIAVIAVGLYFYLSAPPGSLPWLVISVAVATLTQTLAGLVLDSAHCGFVAAVVSIPFVMLVARLRGTPPAAVLSLAAFWSLVPGQLTFMSVSRDVTGDVAGIAGLSTAGASILSIALGSLVGWSLWRAVLAPRLSGRRPTAE